MKKKECPSCAMEIDAKSKACPICAYEFTSTGGGRKWIAVFFLILAILWLISSLFGCKSPTPQLNDTISKTINLIDRIELVDSCGQKKIQLEGWEYEIARDNNTAIIFEIKNRNSQALINAMVCPYMKLCLDGDWLLVEPYREHKAILPKSMFHLIVDMKGSIVGDVFVIKLGLEYR